MIFRTPTFMHVACAAASVLALGGGCFEDPAERAGTESAGSTGAASSGDSEVPQTETTGTSETTETTETAETTETTETTATGETSNSGPETTSSSGGEQICPDVGDPCTICESTECSDDYCGCFNNGACILLAQCVALCDIGDAECNQGCWSLYPTGISDGALLTECAATTCVDACGPYVPLTPCQHCLYAECPDQMNDCIANPECTALLECLDACEAPGCENTCYTAHPDGFADSGPVGECAQDACAQACA